LHDSLSLQIFVSLYILVAVAVAAPVDNTTPIPTTLPQSQQSFEIIPIIKQALDGPSPDGVYSYSYETGNGIQAQEDGHLNNAGTDNEVIEVNGSFSYSDPDGQTYQLSYIANENGFQPQGAHLPTAPPVPPEIQRALEYIAEHPEENEKLDNELENKKLNNEQSNDELKELNKNVQ